MRWWLAAEPERGAELPMEWLAALAQELDATPAGAVALECLKRGRRKALYRGRSPAGAPLLIKVNDYAEGASRARRLRASKARRELEVAARLRAAGIAAPLPLAAGESRAGGQLLRCCLVLRELPGAVDLQQLAAARLAPRERRELARALGELARRLHDAGLDQPDFSPNNLLRVAEGGLVPIDFERARCRRRVAPRRRLEMLAQLESRLPAASDAERWRALLAYARGDARLARVLLPGLGAARLRQARRELAHWRRTVAREGRRFGPFARAGWRGFALRDHPALAALDPDAPAASAALGCALRSGGRPARLLAAATWLFGRGLHAQPIACLARGAELQLWTLRDPSAAPLAPPPLPDALSRARRVALRQLARALGSTLQIPDELWVAKSRPGGRFSLELCAPPEALV